MLLLQTWNPIMMGESSVGLMSADANCIKQLAVHEPLTMTKNNNNLQGPCAWHAQHTSGLCPKSFALLLKARTLQTYDVTLSQQHRLCRSRNGAVANGWGGAVLNVPGHQDAFSHVLLCLLSPRSESRLPRVIPAETKMISHIYKIHVF